MTGSRLLLIAGVALVVHTAQALAQNLRSYDPGAQVDGVTGQVIPCRCRHPGGNAALGDVVCLSTPRGLFKARCTRFENITSWVVSDEPCGSARLRDVGPASQG